MGIARTKLNTLKSYAERSPLPDNLRAIQDLERSIKKSELYSNFLNHPVTKEIVLTLVKQVESINAELLAGKGVTHDVLLRRDEWKGMLQIFDPMRASESALSSHLDFQLNRFKDYYGE